MLGAQSIVSGSLVNMGSSYRFRVKVINVTSAAIETSSSTNVRSDQQMQYLLSQGRSRSTPQTATAQGRPRMEEITVAIVNNTGNDIYGLAFYPSDSTDDSDIQSVAFRENMANRESRRVTLSSIDITRRYILGVSGANSTMFIKDDLTLTQNITITFDSSDRYQPPASAAAPTQPQTQVTPAQSQSGVRTYRIGDIGPAGGLIFYDKGNNSNGWRYLEAAPVEAEVQAPWTVRSTTVDNTQATIGSGRRNTELIVEKFRQTAGEWDTAAQVADDLVYNGFDDWFLPSRDELDQMYGNLKRRNLGEFKDNWYWCSSMEGSSYPYFQNFRDGAINSTSDRSSRRYVRPIRQVAGPS
jgi:hypothetical protein